MARHRLPLYLLLELTENRIVDHLFIYLPSSLLGFFIIWTLPRIFYITSQLYSDRCFRFRACLTGYYQAHILDLPPSAIGARNAPVILVLLRTHLHTSSATY